MKPIVHLSLVVLGFAALTEQVRSQSVMPTVAKVLNQYSSGGTYSTPPVGGPTFNLSENGPGANPGTPSQAEPWQLWANEPITAPLILAATAKATSGSQVSIGLAGQTFRIDGLDCETDTQTNYFIAPLKPHERYQLSLSGSNWKDAKIMFRPYVPRQLLPPRGVNAMPRPYRVYINDTEVLNTVGWEASFDTCGNRTTNMVIELRPDRGLRPLFLSSYEENWSRDEDQDTLSAPGDGQWPEIGPGRSASPSQGAFRWAVSLGRLWNGLTAGKIRLNEQVINASLYDGTELAYTARSTNWVELNVLTNANGSLRQVRTPQCLVDIQSTASPTEECVLRYYILANVANTTNSSGLYAINNDTPFVTWRIRNPDAHGTYNRFQVIEERPSSRSYTSEISYDSGQQIWKMTYGTGTEQRIETRTISVNGTVRQETVLIQSSTGPVYKAIEKYAQFSWGWELTNVISNPDGISITNRFVYCDDNTKPTAYRQLKERWYPGDRWELFLYPYMGDDELPHCDYWPFGDFGDYPGAKIAEQLRVRPWKDGPLNPAAASSLSSVVITEDSGDNSGSLDYHLTHILALI